MIFPDVCEIAVASGAPGQAVAYGLPFRTIHRTRSSVTNRTSALGARVAATAKPCPTPTVRRTGKVNQQFPSLIAIGSQDTATTQPAVHCKNRKTAAFFPVTSTLPKVRPVRWSIWRVTKFHSPPEQRDLTHAKPQVDPLPCHLHCVVVLDDDASRCCRRHGGLSIDDRRVAPAPAPINSKRLLATGSYGVVGMDGVPGRAGNSRIRDVRHRTGCASRDGPKCEHGAAGAEHASGTAGCRIR